MGHWHQKALSGNSLHSIHHSPKFEVGLNGPSQVLHGRKDMTCIIFSAPGHFLATSFYVNVSEYHSALWHFSSGSDEYIHNSATVKMWQQKSFSLSPPSEKMCRCQKLRCGTIIFIQHVWNPLSTGLLAIQWASKHTSCRYSHFCCNCYEHQDAIFLQHSTNIRMQSSFSTAQTSGCSLLWAQHKHAPHLPSVEVVSIPLQGAYFVFFHPPQMAFIPPPTHGGQFHRMGHESLALQSRPHHPPMAFSQAGNENLSQCAQLNTRNFLAAILSPPFS
jgi:hypothetical protein